MDLSTPVPALVPPDPLYSCSSPTLSIIVRTSGHPFILSNAGFHGQDFWWLRANSDCHHARGSDQVRTPNDGRGFPLLLLLWLFTN